MSVRAITPNDIKKKKKNNFRKLFLLVDSFLTLLDMIKEEDDENDEWRRYMGTMRVYIKSEKGVFLPLRTTTKGRLISALHKIYSNYGYYIVDFISFPPPPLRPHCRYISEEERVRHSF